VRLRHTAPLLAALPLIAGCGGGGKSQPSGPTRAQYIAQTDAICSATKAKAAPQLRALSSAGSSLNPLKLAKLGPLAEQVRTTADAYLHQLQAVPQPAADAAAINDFLNPTRATVQAIDKAAGQLSSGNVLGAVGGLNEIQALANTANAAAATYGLHDCAKVLSLS
jgi:hypothetical protein